MPFPDEEKDRSLIGNDPWALPTQALASQPEAIPAGTPPIGSEDPWALPAPGTASLAPAAALPALTEEQQTSADRIERLARKHESAAVEVERSFPEEVGASVVRGALGLAKLPFQLAKIVGSDVMGPVVKGITGTDIAKRLTEPVINYLEETAESPTWKPSKEAGGTPVDLDRIIQNPGEVAGQIASQATNPRFWASQLPEGAMSIIPFIVGTWIPRVLMGANTVIKGIQAAEAVGDVAKVTELGAKLARIYSISTKAGYGSAMAIEAAQGEEKVREYEEKTGETVKWGSRVASILGTGVVAGALEAFSLGRVLPSALLGRKAPTPMAVIENILNGRGGREIVNKVLAGVATEGLTEGAQTIVENAFPRYFFDKNQKLLEGVVESILIGAALGGLGGGAESINVRREAGAFARESGAFSQQYQDEVKATATRIQEASRLAREESQSEAKPISPEGPPEPILAPRVERPGPQPTAPTPEAQHQAIFGGGPLVDIIESQPDPNAAIRSLSTQVGSWEKAARFYDLYQQGDAATALQEFPEFSAWVTPAQQAARTGVLPGAFTGRPRQSTPAPMGVAGVESATRATTPAPGAVGPVSPGGTTPSPTLPAAPGPTRLAGPMGVAGAESQAVADAERRGKALADEVLQSFPRQTPQGETLDSTGYYMEETAPGTVTSQYTGGIIPQAAARRMAAQEIDRRLANGEAVEPEVLARFPEVAAKYGLGEPAAPQQGVTVPEGERWPQGATPTIPVQASGQGEIAPEKASNAFVEGDQGPPPVPEAPPAPPTPTKPQRVKFDRADLGSAVDAAKRLQSDTDRFIFATGQGFTIWHEPPPGGQDYVVVRPDGSHEVVRPEVGATPVTPAQGPAPSNKAQELVRHIQAYQGDRYSPEITKLKMELGLEVVPGIRLGDADDAGLMYVLLREGKITGEEWDAYVADLEASNKIRKPQVPGAAPTLTPLADTVLETPKPLPGLLAQGNEATAITSRGTDVKVRWAIAEVGDLVTSHDNALDENPDYPKDLQPRDRTRVASKLQVAKIANNLDPRQLADSPLASDGAPIIGPDNVVESGNARTIAVNRVYYKDGYGGQANNYKQWLVDNVERFGIDPGVIRQATAPILVRVRTEEVIPQERVQLTREFNERSTAPMSPSEQARSDARVMMDSHILDLFKPNDEGEILRAGNHEFIRRFMSEVVGDREMGAYYDSKGQINQAGIIRIRNAIFAAAYGDTAALEKLAESTSDAARNITTAMTMVAPRMAIVQRKVQGGHLYPLELNGQLSEAATILQTLREQGIGIEDYLAQGNMLEQIPPLTADLLKFFGDFGRSRNKITATLNAYLDIVEAAGNPRQGALVDTGFSLPTREEVLQAAIQRMEAAYGKGTAVSPDLQQGETPSGEVPVGTTGKGPEVVPESKGPGLTAPTPKPKPLSPIDQKLAIVKEQFKDIDEDKARRVLRALPNASPTEVVAMVQDEELFNLVARGNLTDAERRTIAQKLQKLQPGLPGLGTGGLFDVTAEPKPKLPPGIAPKKTPVPSFKAGDRVSWTERGKKLTGTIENGPDKAGEVDIRVDQTTAIHGVVPIGRVSVGVKVENLTKLEAAPEEKAAAAPPVKFKLGDKVRAKPDAGMGFVADGATVTHIQTAPDGTQKIKVNQGGGHFNASNFELVPAPEQAAAAHVQLASQVKGWFESARETWTAGPISSAQLWAWADKAYDGTMAEGKYTPKDAYDAMELGVNQFIQAHLELYNPHSEDPAQVVKALEGLIKFLPTQSRRTGESDEFQQFSTPPPLAYVVAWAANIGPNDVALEPSGGIGGIAVFAQNAGAQEVIVNELSPRRAELLREMGFGQVFTENAEQLNNVLPKEVKPTVVMMNPPFSSTAGRMLGVRDTMTGAQHIEQALKRLEPGGRLVAIVGRGMAFGTPTFGTWWEKIRKEYNVLANVGVSGKNYAKYGTTFDNQILVIDKTGSTTQNPVAGAVENIQDLIPLLEGVKDARTVAGKQLGSQPSVQAGVTPTETQPQPRPSRPVSPATPGLGEEEGAGAPSDDTGGRGVGDVRPPTEPSAIPSGPSDNAGVRGGVRGGPAGTGVSVQPDEGVRPGDRTGGVGTTDSVDDGEQHVPGQLPPGRGRNVTVEAKEAEETKGAFTDSVYEDYQPKRVKLPGAKPHPSPLKESAAMASVLPPAPTYTPNLPQHVITEGNLSAAQLEAVVYAGQSHSQMLPSGERRGFAIGDGTGLGKGREVAAIFWDNWSQGRRKGVWISKGNDLIKDAQRDMAGAGWDPSLVKKLPPAGAAIKDKEGIVFTAYSTLRGGQAIQGQQQGGQPAAPVQTRVDQLVKWLGEDFDGVIAFDEAHHMNNLGGPPGHQGAQQQGSQMARAAVELQRRLPNARVVYVSATLAEEPRNLAFADRLGLWGPETAFADRNVFLNEIESGGVASMEVVARDMKALGKYMSRNLSYDDVQYERLIHKLTPEQTQLYNELAGSWQIIFENITDALDDTGADRAAKRQALAMFWMYNQSFFNQIVTSLQMPSLLTAMEADLAKGHSPILQLVNTYGAAQERTIANKPEGVELDELDLTPRQMLIQYLERAYPVQQYEEYTDDNGDVRTRPVVDSQGNPVLNQDAVAARNRLVTEMGMLRFPDTPLDQVINKFGPDMVAEVTGRKQRIVKYRGETKLEKRGNAAAAKDTEAFNNDKKRILIFSGKGDTGASYHADLTYVNQRLRRHYLVQPGWQAKRALQGLGRSHRTNQKQAPEFILVESDIKGQKRFISAIARRLDQLGALTKGQRQTGSSGLLKAEDNLETNNARRAVEDLVDDLLGNRVPGLTAREFEKQTGWKLTYSSGGAITVNYPTIKQFMNRLLAMNIEKQDIAFETFDQRHKEILAREAEFGTLDLGMETIVPDKGGRIDKVSEELVYTEPDSKAETSVVAFDMTNPTKPRSFADVRARQAAYYTNNQSGHLWAVDPHVHTKTADDGRVTQVQVAFGQGETSRRWIDRQELMDRNRWTPRPESAAKTMWDEAVDKLPKETTEKIHMITGALLPIWDRLSGATRIYRLQDDKGKRYLGRVIPESSLNDTLTRLGATPEAKSLEVKTAQDVYEKVYDNNWNVTLANGWKFRRALVSGEQRIELVGVGSEHLAEMERLGMIVERINYQTRLFVPIRSGQTADSVSIIAQIIDKRPVTEAAPRFQDQGTGRYKLAQAGIATGGVRLGEGGTVTLQAVQKTFGPQIKVSELAGGAQGFSLVLPSDKVVVILTGKNLEATREETLRTYGREPQAGDWIAGKWEPLSIGGVISLAKGAGQKTLHHETFHTACDLVLTQKELDTILKEHGDWESAALAYENWKPAEPHTLFQKILDFFKRLAQTFRPTAAGVFTKIKSGEVWVRTEAGPGAGTTGMFALRPAEAETRLQTYQDKMVAPEGKESGWQNFKNTVLLRGDTKQEAADTLHGWYDQLVDRYAPLERAETRAIKAGGLLPAGETPTYTLAYWRGQEGWTAQAVMKNGVYHETIEAGRFTDDNKKVGESLTKRLDPIRELAERRGEKPEAIMNDLFNRFMVAQRDLELAGETGVRGPGEIKGVNPAESQAVLRDLQQVYGADYEVLETVAGRLEANGNFTPDSIREWSDQAILQRLEQAGLISPELRQEIKARNQFYLPFRRLMDEVDNYVEAYATALGVKGKVIETIKGSKKQVMDPLQMLMDLAAKANYAYARNRVLDSMAKLGQYDPEIKEVNAKFVPVDETLKQEIDKPLRDSLMKVVQALGVDFQMLKTLRGRRLGQFISGLREEVKAGALTVAQAREIQVRFATTEKVLSHEVGHAIDDQFNLVQKMIVEGTPEMKRELRAIADQRAGLDASPSYKRYVRKRTEQVAEFVARFINHKEVVRALAPKTTAYFEDFLAAKKVLEPLRELRPSHQLGTLDFQNRVWARSPLPPEPGTVPYYRDGRQKWLKLPPDMFLATQNMMPQDLGLLLTWAKKPADLLRAGAVTTPEFSLGGNPPRDIIQAWIFSRFGFSPLKWFRDLGLLLSKDPATMELRNQAEAGGGFMATLAQSMIAPERITADDITGKKKGMWYAAHPIQAMRHVSAYLENMTRFSIYKQGREKGLSHAEAIHEMRRTTLDFRRTGNNPTVRYLNMIIPFFNASIQGTDKLLSELAGPNKHAVMRRLAMLTAGSIGLWLLAHNDDRYKELENWERNYFWHIPLGKDGPMIRLPKPFEAGILFGSVPERILDQLVDKNVGGVKSALGAAWKALTPDFIPAFARGLIEGGTNYNWFLDRPIEDQSLQALPVEMRSKPWTTELAKALSKYVGPAVSPVMELSPVKVEHLIRTMSGGLGANYFLPGIDVVLRKAGVLEDIPQPEQDTIQEIWGVRAFFTKPPTGYRAKSVNDFFETSQKATQADQGWKALWNSGSMDKLDAFLQDNPEAMFARVARTQMTELGKIKKERNTIYQSKTMDPAQKRAKLDVLDEKVVNLARAGNALMDPAVAEAVKMPSRFTTEMGARKSLDLDGYYKLTVESVGDAYDKLKLQKDLPRILRMDGDQRQRYLIRAIRQARDEYQPILKKPEDVVKPYRFSGLLDKPTRAERANSQALFGVRKIYPGQATGYRLKEEKETDHAAF